MNIKKISTYTLAAIGTLALCSGYAATSEDAAKCISSAAKDAGYVLDQVRALYNTGHGTAALDSLTATYSGFNAGGGNSSDTAGVAYLKFGPESTGSNDYMLVAYLGNSCGAASNTKFKCFLQHKDASGEKFSANQVLDSNFSRLGFYMSCELCSGVELAAGTEEAKTASDGLAANELAQSAVTGVASAVAAAANHGVLLSSSVTPWASNSPGPAACNEVPQA